MYILYNIALYVGFVLLTPRFLYDALTKGKYAAGFSQRLGSVPPLQAGDRRVVLLHCVSVGEANAALPLARRLKQEFPDIALVVTTTTKTGQAVAGEIYRDLAERVIYFPFDFRFAVKRFLRRIAPDVVLLTETELWFNFIREAFKSDIRLAIVNGRLSERSFRRYTWIKGFMRRILAYPDLALMQGKADAQRLMSLGARGSKVKVTGNLKFDVATDTTETELTLDLRRRFALGAGTPVIVAASTHAPEEEMLLDVFKKVCKPSEPGQLPRLILVPRHPERFHEVGSLIRATGFSWVRRSEDPSAQDKSAQVILLDSVGELKSVYPLADIAFVGGSLIPHGGQSIFEPAAAGKAIVTGPYTANFDAVVREFLSRDGLIQLPEATAVRIVEAFETLLSDVDRRRMLGRNALAVMEANRGAVDRTVEYLAPLIAPRG